MTEHGKGWLIFLAAFGMMLGLIAIDIAKIDTWSEVSSPEFVANIIGHIATVIAAFIGGKLIPVEEK